MLPARSFTFAAFKPLRSPKICRRERGGVTIQARSLGAALAFAVCSAVAFGDDAPRWVYRTMPDPISDRPAAVAAVASTNVIELRPPYDGAQRATLTLRNHPRHGLDVMLSVQRGQFACGVGGCKVTVRIDDGAPGATRRPSPAMAPPICCS